MNGRNVGENIQANLPYQIGGQNENNRDGMSQTPYNYSGSIINWIPKGLVNFHTKELNMEWGE